MSKLPNSNQESKSIATYLSSLLDQSKFENKAFVNLLENHEPYPIITTLLTIYSGVPFEREDEKVRESLVTVSQITELLLGVQALAEESSATRYLSSKNPESIIQEFFNKTSAKTAHCDIERIIALYCKEYAGVIRQALLPLYGLQNMFWDIYVAEIAKGED